MSDTAARDLYQDVILRRARQPHHMHRLEPYDASGFGDNPMCGDQIEVRVLIGPDSTVRQAAYEARGCAISLASADLMADAVRGRTQSEIEDLRDAFLLLTRTGTTGDSRDALAPLLALSGVSEYPSRIKCATLPWSALMSALTNYAGAHGGNEHS